MPGPQQLQQAINKRDANCPCNDCGNAARCQMRKLACRDFAHYVSTGKHRRLVRGPSRRIYIQLQQDDAA